MKKYSFVKGLLPADGLDFVGFHNSPDDEAALEVFLSKEVVIPMLQHVGSPCIPSVDIGTYVRIGQLIGKPGKDPNGSNSCIHASISGRVTEIKQIRLPDGRECEAVCIVSDGKRSSASMSGPMQDYHERSPQELYNLLYRAGIVGMGGEGYPAHYKCKTAKNADTILVNGMQSEPYLTCDSFQLREYTDRVIRGAAALAAIVQAGRVLVCLQDKWVSEINAVSDSIDRLRPSFPDRELDFVLFKSRYPQGYDRLIVQALFGGDIGMTDSLERDYNVIVFNVSTCSAFFDMIEKNMPCTSRIITLAGDRIGKKNLLVPIGTKISEILTAVPGIAEARIILGGALTGVYIQDLNTPVLKTTTGIMVIENPLPDAMRCIRCGSCVHACPVQILPYLSEKYILEKRDSELQKMNLHKCISCGSCSYVCPAHHQLSFHIARYAHQLRMRSGEKEKQG